MKNMELLYALSEIGDQYIQNTLPVNKKKHFSFVWVAAAACVCLALVGLGVWRSGIFDVEAPSLTPPENSAVVVPSLPEYNAIGGEGHFEYERAYVPKLYQLDSALMDYIVESGGADLYEWLEQETEAMKRLKYNISNPNYVPTLLRVIEKYNVPKDEFERINNHSIAIYEKNGDYSFIEQVCYTQEEVDALYSKNAAKITEVFATKYAIIVGDKAYAPSFYLNATEQELKEVAISRSVIEEKVKMLLADGVITE
ncbi:MAG: hypothetical protein IJC46_04645 [Clostridia bacterium]|nr:hypothetical protein [Clostridia bacterium]